MSMLKFKREQFEKKNMNKYAFTQWLKKKKQYELDSRRPDMNNDLI